MIASILATLLVGPAPEAALPSEPTQGAVAPEPARLEHGYLRIDGLERDSLVEALVLRVPHLRFEPFEAAAANPLGTSAAFVELRRVAPNADDGPTDGPTDDSKATTFELTIVVSDGRAFDRKVQAPTDDHETTRLLASTVANLLLAIEAGTVPADRGDVPLPAAVLPPAPPCECECPEPSCPVPPPAKEPPALVPPPAPRLELGPVLGLGTVLGLGQPSQADRFAAVGGTVGAHARLRNGAFFGLELRTSGRGDVAGTTIVRQRFALGAGYRLRGPSWSLGVSLWGTVEPWWLRGAPIDPPPRPLWGVVARVTPSLYRIGLAGGRLDLAVGPVVELGASAALSDDAAQIGLVTVLDDDAVISRRRVGGLELSTGLAATLWLGPRPRPRPRR